MLAFQIEATNEDVDIFSFAANCLGLSCGTGSKLLPGFVEYSHTTDRGHVSKGVQEVRVQTDGK